jgi:hypothetical protein
VRFASAAPFAVCAHCQSLLLRRDIGLETVGKVASVPEDISPLQLGTSGVFDQRHFTLVGRIRKVWDQGSWNEWFALFDDHRLGWLAEAQGDLVMTFEQPLDAPTKGRLLSVLGQVAPGSVFPIGGRKFSASDIKQVVCAAADGELAAYVPNGTAMTCVDLHGPGLEFATLERVGQHVSLFVGRFVEFDECRFSGLRPLEGWMPRAAQTGR